jgi:hypothetical protein
MMKNRILFFVVAAAAMMMFSSQVMKAQNQELTSAQEMCLIVASKVEVPEIKYVEVAPPKYWTNGIMTQLGFSQVSLTNWASGGVGSVAMNAYMDAHANYKKGLMIWENRANVAYGFVNPIGEGERFKKSDDRFQLESKWGYGVANKLYASAVFNFRTQFARGYNYGATPEDDQLTSSFMAPGYISLGLGVDWKPAAFLSVNMAPLTGNMVVVTDPELRSNYGWKDENLDKTIRKELGAQLKAEAKHGFKNVTLGTTVTLFYDYLSPELAPQVYWDLNLDFKFAKFFSANLRTNLIYDENILFKDNQNDPDDPGRPKVQFKEAFSLSFTYTFGNYQKKQ